MRPERTRHGYPVSLFSLVVDAWIGASLDFARPLSVIVARMRQSRARACERRQLSRMSEREWADIGLTKCDAVMEVEKPSHRP